MSEAAFRSVGGGARTSGSETATVLQWRYPKGVLVRGVPMSATKQVITPCPKPVLTAWAKPLRPETQDMLRRYYASLHSERRR